MGKPWRRALLWLAAAAAVFAVVQLLARVWPDGVDGYGAFVSFWIVRPLSLATGALPFSVGEIALAGYAAWMLHLGIRALARVARGAEGAAGGGPIPTRAARALSGGAARLATHAGILFLVFTLLWGFNYARPGVEERLGWPEWEGVGVEELELLARRAVDATNRAYVELHGTEDLGRSTPMDDWSGVEAALDAAWEADAPHLLGDPRAAPRRGRGKRPLLSPVLRRLGVSGLFFPFTAEAWVTADLPAVSAPNTLAHEKAHQRGVAGEADAGFVGALVGATAPHPLARYSAAAYVQMQVMRALAQADRERWLALARTRVPGVQRDLDDLAAYWAAHRGPARQLRVAANDAYLRAHGVAAGVGDYGRTVHLLVAWARLHPGWILPE